MAFNLLCKLPAVGIYFKMYDMKTKHSKQPKSLFFCIMYCPLYASTIYSRSSENLQKLFMQGYQKEVKLFHEEFLLIN